VRTDDLGAVPLRALMARNKNVDWQAVSDVLYGCANQAGEDNRNVARMSALLAGLPLELAGATINRLCGSGLDAVGTAARAIKRRRSRPDDRRRRGEHEPRALRHAQGRIAFSRNNAVYDTTIGWRFVNKLMKAQYGVDSMPETAENVATDFKISREDQDLMALASQLRPWPRRRTGFFDAEIVTRVRAAEKGRRHHRQQGRTSARDQHGIAGQAQGVVRPDGTVTAGNASGVNDGACALLLADEASAARHGLTPRARVVGMATAGVAPRIMGIGPAPATQKVLALTGLTIDQMDVIELNEAFAAQGLAVLRQLGLKDDDARVNANGGAIALGHPLGASGARLATTAVNQLHKGGGRYALCTMCIGVGQGIA
jgi:acetyl-CoA acyltransferase